MKKVDALITSITIVSLAFISRFPFAGSEDIMAARETMVSGIKKDFWGSFSPWFFSIWPGSHWEIAYAIFFSILMFISLYMLLVEKKAPTLKSSFRIPLIVLLGYCSSLFVLSFSRDGSLLAFVLFGFGISEISNFKASARYQKIIRVISYAMFTIGYCFRPWLAFSLPFLIQVLEYRQGTILFSRYFQKIASLVLISIIPIVLEGTFHTFLQMENSYPEQQVMIMDLSSIACLSSDKAISEKALKSISITSNKIPLDKGSLCGQYYPASWASVAIYGATPAKKNVVHVIGPNENPVYQVLRENWIRLISSYPLQYIQIKLLLSSQLLFAGDSPVLSIHSFSHLLAIPFEILKALRLFSVFPTLILLYFSLRFLLSRNYISNLCAFHLSSFYLSSITLVGFAFIGDNQRYVLPFFIMVSLVLLNLQQRQTLTHE